MSERMPFIGRTEEMEQISGFLTAWGTRQVVFVQGKGGIGKTRLLEEVYSRLQVQENSRLVIGELIDFDNRTLHFPRNLERMIAQLLGKKAFEPYMRTLLDLRKMEMANVSHEALQQQEEKADQQFVANLNQVSSERRVVLLFDTTEQLDDSEVWDRLCALFGNAQNTLFLLAGRNAEHYYEILEPRFKTDAQLILLQPLDTRDRKEYLEQKLRRLHITIEPELAQQLLLLSQGRPILVDLAAEWMSRARPLPQVVGVKPQEFNSFSEAKREKLQQDFEAQLVAHIADVRNDIDRLVLVMSRIYPLDVDMIRGLLKLSKKKSQSLYKEAQTYVFVKTLPDGRISLHDEMRRMVHDHLWPEIDINGDRRRGDSALAAEILTAQVRGLAQRIDQMEIEEQSARDASDFAAELDLFVTHQAQEEELWVLQEGRLRHTLYADLDRGVQVFIEVFDEATRAYHTAFRQTIIDQAEAYVEQMSPEQRYELDSRQAKHLTDKGEYLLAKELVIESLAREGIEPEQRVNLLTSLANANTWLGELQQSAELLKDALQLCSEVPGLARWEGTVLNNLGRVTRMMGCLEDATQYYERALRKVSDRAQIASIFNDIGYMWSLQGRYRSALNYCKEALSIRRQLELKRQIGASLSTIGEIHRNWGKYDDAMVYYNEALEIFEPEGDPLWLARLYSYRGAVYRLQDQFDLAESDLRQSIECNVRILQPWAYHVLGCVFWNREALDQALEFFRISDELAREVYDVRSQVNNLVAHAEIYYLQWTESSKKDDHLAASIRQKAMELDSLLSQGYDFPHHSGRMKRVVADLAFDEKNYDEALDIYAEAYALLGGRSGGYGRRTFFDELDMLTQRIEALARDDAQRALHWCRHLRDYWTDPDRSIMRLDELVSMCDICELGIKFNYLNGEQVDA